MNYSVDVETHSVSALKADIDFVHDNLKLKHPGIYWYISKEKLDFKFDSLKNTINKPLKSRELFVKLAPVVASINCGHTRLILVTKNYTARERDSINSIGVKPIAQFNYIVKAEKLFIKTNSSADTSLKPGTEIFEINGEPVAKIINKIENGIPSDGYNKTFKEAVLNRAFGAWYNSFYGTQDSVNFKLLTKNNVLKPHKPQKVVVKIKPLTDAEKKQKKKEQREALKQRYRGLDENKKPLLEFKFLNQDSSAAYVKIKSFSFPFANFDRFYAEAFGALKKANTKDLVIDLRNNGGGSLTACRNLFAYLTDKDFTFVQPAEATGRFVNGNGSFANTLLAPIMALSNLLRIKKDDNGKYYAKLRGTKPLHPKKDNFKGRVFVLINGYSFSASTLFSANMKGINRAIFVGTEAGGGFNQCTAGRIPVINLPNSKLKLRFGLYKIAPVVQADIYGRGIFPNIPVNRSVEEELQNKDPEMDYVLKKIKETT